MSNRDPSRYLTVAETAERLQVAPVTVRRLIYRGELPAVKVGDPGRRNTPLRVDPVELDQWLHSSGDAA